MISIYFRKLKQTTKFTSWLFHSWNLPVVDGGYMRLGQRRERGFRLLGVEFIWFRDKGARASYERSMS